MAPEARSLRARLAGADARKVARWSADRARRAVQLAGWHAGRVWTQACDALGLLGPLPPGSLRASSVVAATSDEQFYLKELQRHGPIFKLFWGSGDLKICMVGYPRGRSLLHRHRSVLYPVSRDIKPLVPGDYLRGMRPEIHPRYRRLFKGALQDDLVEVLRPELRSLARRELAGLAAGEPRDEAPAARLFGALDRICTRSLLRVVLGVGPEAALAPALEGAYERLGPNGYVEHVGPEQVAAFAAIRTAVLQVVQSLGSGGAAASGDSILGRLVRAGPDAIDDTVIGNAIYMVERGRHDLRDLVRWIVKHLSDHPPFVAELRATLAEPEAGARLARASVLETLRLEQAEAVNRKALEEFTFEGYRFPKGSLVSILMRETHRDPAVFPEPDRFRPQRFLERSYSADEYAPFGLGEHQCIAASLVVTVGTMFVEELVGGYTWTVIGDGPRTYEAGRFHWEPSHAFAIELVPAR